MTTVTTVFCLILTLLFTPSYAMNGKCDSLRRQGLGIRIAEPYSVALLFNSCVSSLTMCRFLYIG